jgi:hypothetical protein
MAKHPSITVASDAASDNSLAETWPEAWARVSRGAARVTPAAIQQSTRATAVSTARHIETAARLHVITAATNPVRNRYIDDALSLILAAYRQLSPGVIHIPDVPRRFRPRHMIRYEIGEVLGTPIEQIE